MINYLDIKGKIFIFANKNKNVIIMCLKTNRLNFKTSKKDITCYKLLCEYFPGCYYTPFMHERIGGEDGVPSGWSQNATKDIEARRDRFIGGGNYAISKGVIYSFVNKDDAIACCKEMVDKWYLPCKRHIFKCIIPAGVGYIKGSVDMGFATSESYGSYELEYQDNVMTYGDFDEEEDNFIRLFKIIINNRISWAYMKDNVPLYKKLLSYLCENEGFNPVNELANVKEDLQEGNSNKYIPLYDLYNGNIMSWFLGYACNNDIYTDGYISKIINTYAVNVAINEIDDNDRIQHIVDKILNYNVLSEIQWDEIIFANDILSTSHINEYFKDPITYLTFMANDYRHQINMTEYYVIRQMIKVIDKKIKE